jgi:CubicO group peptidase (beta-lactamase class C family)
MKPWRIDGLAPVRWAAFALIAALAAASPNVRFADASPPAIRSFSQAGLQQIGDYMRDEIATGNIPGAILKIQQHGKSVYFEKFGLRNVVARLPMTDDTIFRLYSMSKPITSDARRGRQAFA